MLNSGFFLHPALARKSIEAQEIQAKFIGKGRRIARRKKEDGKETKPGKLC